ncbi:MAG: hypothetical protein U0575_07300 [Phycisphaerales bacterium]
MRHLFQMKTFCHGTVIAIVAVVQPTARGGFVLFDNFAGWTGGVGTNTTIGFTGLPSGTFLDTQYQDLGVTFTEGNDVVNCCSFVVYPLDGAGLNGNTDTITMLFDTPQTWLGVSYPGGLQIDLYSGNALVYSSGQQLCCGNGYGFFGGVVGTETFDRVVLSDWQDGYVFIDSVFFGSSVPTPATLLPLLWVTMIGRRRRV